MLPSSPGSLVLGAVASSGSELVKEPFRWDQRVFCTVMQLPGTVIGSGPPAGAGSEERALRHTECSLAVMCEITGGRCVAVTGMRALLQNMVRALPCPQHQPGSQRQTRCVWWG